MRTLYLDMDGVLADFDKKSIELLGKRLKDFPDSQSGWAAMIQHQNIYDILDPMPDARDLVNGVFDIRETFDFEIAILTAIPRVGSIPDARLHKRQWILRHFPELIFNFNIGPHAKHKQFHARAGDVLIDDSELNIPQWIDKGGYGILHTSAEDSLMKLELYLKSLAG
jgi:5'(3')-deoxyribonucleotidase